MRTSHRCSLGIAVLIAWKCRKDTSRLIAEVLLSARGSDITALIIVGICRRKAIGTKCRNCNILVIGTWITCRIDTIIASSENHNTAIHRRAVTLLDEIFNRLVLNLQQTLEIGITIYTAHIGREAPGTLQHRSAHICRIENGVCHTLIICLYVIREYLARYHTYAITLARAASNTADTDTIVVGSSDNTCYVSAMTLVIGSIPRYGAIGREVVAMNIVHIAIIIIIDTLDAICLCLIYPHIIFEVLVRIVHTLIDNGDNNIGTTSRKRPSGIYIGISTNLRRRENLDITRILIVPLQRQLRVVEAELLSTSGRHVRHIGWSNLHLGQLRLYNKLNTANRLQRCKLHSNPIYIYLFIETYDVPTVQTVRLTTLDIANHIDSVLNSRGTQLRSHI